MAPKLESLDPRTLLDRLRRHRMGVIVGPMFTLGEATYIKLRDLLAIDAGKWDRGQTLLGAIEAALQRGKGPDEIKRQLHHVGSSYEPPPGILALAGLPTNAVISLRACLTSHQFAGGVCR